MSGDERLEHPRAITELPRGADTGFVVTDADLLPVYANDAALALLSFPATGGAVSPEAIQHRMRVILQMQRISADAAPKGFLSGKRRYVCRPFLLEPLVPPAKRKMIGFYLERSTQKSVATIEAAEKYRLSPRERETLEHLSRGLKTKEIAVRMAVSPNTVKQFIRLVATKVGASTRSGIVGKVMRG